MAVSGDLVTRFIGDASSLRKETNAARELIGSFGGYVKGVLATAGIGFGLGQAFGEAFDLESTIVQFKVLLGEQEKAVALTKELRSFAATTPLQFGDIAASTKLLLNAGIAVEGISSELQMLGDLASAGGKNLGDVAFVYAQVRTAGRLMGQDLNQLLNANIPVIKLLAKEFGVAEGEVRNLVSTGAVTFDRLRSALKRATDEGGQLNGMMKELSQTGTGLWSTLKDNATTAAAGFGAYLTNTFFLKDALRAAADGAQLLAENIEFVTRVTVASIAATILYTAWIKRKTIADAVSHAVASKGLSLLRDFLVVGAGAAAIYGAMALAESAMGSATEEAARDVKKLNQEMQETGEVAGQLAGKNIPIATKEFEELLKKLRAVNDLPPKDGGIFNGRKLREDIQIGKREVDNFLLDMARRIRPVNVELEQLGVILKEFGVHLDPQQVDLIMKMMDAVTGDKVAKQERSLLDEIEATKMRIANLDAKRTAEEQKVFDLSGGTLNHLEKQGKLLNLLNVEKQKLDDIKMREESDKKHADYMQRETDRMRDLHKEAERLGKTESEIIRDKLLEFQAAGVQGDKYQDAAVALALQTGLFNHGKSAHPVSQSALTAVSGSEAISAVNQFNREMERQKAEAEQQAKRDAEANAARVAIYDALLANKVPLEKIESKLNVGEEI